MAGDSFVSAHKSNYSPRSYCATCDEWHTLAECANKVWHFFPTIVGGTISALTNDMQHKMARNDYKHLGGQFEKAHRDFVGLEEMDVSSLSKTYSERELERGRKAFVLRALDEQRSLLAFSELLAELAEARAPIDVIGSLTRVVRDEARHVDLCGRLVESLGGFGSDAPEPHWVRSDKRIPLKRRILKTIVGSLCVGETVSIAMIRGVRDHASDPLAHEVLTQMLTDESFHSRFGWWWLEHTELTDEDHLWVRKYLKNLLPAVEKGVRPSAKAMSRKGKYTYNPFGSMMPKERDDAFMWSMTQRILPEFDRLGFDATSIWNNRPELKRNAA